MNKNDLIQSEVFIKKDKKEIFPLNPEFDAKFQNSLEEWNLIIFDWLTPLLRGRFNKICLKCEFSNFFEGVRYEYGVDGTEINLNKAYEIYQKSAMTTTDLLSMYKMYSIHFKEYNKFKIERDRNLEKFFLFKAFAFSSGSTLNHYFPIYNKVEIFSEVSQHITHEDPDLSKFIELIEYLDHNIDYQIPSEDLQIIQDIVCIKFFKKEFHFNSLINLNKLVILQNLEAIYKMGVLFMDSKQAEESFLICENKKYYRSYADYGIFVLNKLQDSKRAIKIFKEGYQNGNIQCYFLYFDAYCNEYYNEILKKNPNNIEDIFELFDVLLNDLVTGNIFSIFEFFFFRKLCIKHFDIGEIIDKKFKEYAYEIVDLVKNLIEKNKPIEKTFNPSFGKSEILLDYGYIHYLGIKDYLIPDQSLSYDYFHQSFKNSNTISFKRFCYSFIVSIRNKLYKNNKISKEKYDKTCKKIYRMFNTSIVKGKVEDFSPSFYYYLGKLEENGIGTKKNIVKAYSYYQKASEKGVYFLGSGSIIAHYRKVKSFKKLIDANIKQAISIIDHISISNDHEGYGATGEICCICFDNKRDTLLIPCLHIICNQCNAKLPDKEVCPICRGKILSTKQKQFS